MILVFGSLDGQVNLIIGIITLAAGMAFVYADSIAVRVGGILLCLAGLFQMGLDRNRRFEAEFVIGAAVIAGLAVAILSLCGPRWTRVWNRKAEGKSERVGPKSDPRL
jgi:hypothetical protein